MACNDVRGQQVLDACQRSGICVPDEVAVVGVDNDEVLCELCNPPLSSVVPNPQRIGYEAAALLAQLMAGSAPDPEEMLIEPVGVTTRQSSDVLAIVQAMGEGRIDLVRVPRTQQAPLTTATRAP